MQMDTVRAYILTLYQYITRNSADFLFSRHLCHMPCTRVAGCPNNGKAPIHAEDEVKKASP